MSPVTDRRRCDKRAPVPGFEILDADGGETASLGARVAAQGGYLHVAVPGRDDIQMLSATAVRGVTYRVTSHNSAEADAHPERACRPSLDGHLN